MYALQGGLSENFTVKNHNSTGATQVTDANRNIFVSEASLDTAIGSIHAAKDKPYLTMNDKVFAARYSIAVVNPTVLTGFEQPVAPTAAPHKESGKKPDTK